LDEFALPVGWFSKVFGSGHGPELTRQYLEQFQYFKYSTVTRLKPTVPRIGCMVTIQTSLTESVEIRSPSFDLPAVQRLAVHCTTKVYDDKVQWVYGSSDETWLDSFICVDGAFRFYGKGASTFSIQPEFHLADPCSASGKQIGGKPIQLIEPFIQKKQGRNTFRGL
jgi:hypothetical protein